MKIFVVDDEPFAARLLTHQLGRLGFTDVAAYHDATEAIGVLEADPGAADVVLLDLQMPELDGVEFVRRLATRGYPGGLVLVSGEDERLIETVRKLAVAHQLDVRGALHKPATPAQLEAVLGTVTPGTRRADAPAREAYTPDRVQQAIETGELITVYQPKAALATGHVHGVETLMRWQHPDDGLVSPDAFIPIAEEHGLIEELTRASLRMALRDLRSWLEQGVDVHVGVNVSMDNLVRLDFPDLVIAALAEVGVPATRLVLEVTESRLMRNVVAALDILTRLRLRHIALSIDDFGTGHSSLAQLRDIPFTELKLDKSFVHGARQNIANRAIVQANLHLARELGMRSVAEGVEDRDDWNLLRELGCDLAQGYFVSRPMPAAEFPRWTAAWEARRVELMGG